MKSRRIVDENTPATEPGDVWSDEGDTITHNANVRSEHGANLEVGVIEGPDAGAKLVVPARPVLVGTSPGCDLVLRDRTVSRSHLELRTAFGEAVIRDVGSHNGTFVRGVRVIEASLPIGAEITIGSTRLAVRGADEGTTAAISSAKSFGRVIGGSLAMRQLFPVLERLAASDVTVLIEGETGTGKEILAEAIHEQSARRDGPFVVLDCTAIPANLVEAELFGHERGAFTGAVGARKGLLELAQRGTLLIDELGELEPTLQPKLLRVIERREFRRIGGSSVIRVDVRILAATRKNLDEEVFAGRFRDDLFHRFAVARVLVPPLRVRTGDVPLLARHFLREVSASLDDLPPEVMARLEEYRWPGNVRELRNAVERYCTLGSVGEFSRERKPIVADGDVLTSIAKQGLPYPVARDAALDAFNAAYVAEMLARHGGNVSKAAAASGIARRYFQQIKSRGR